MEDNKLSIRPPEAATLFAIAIIGIALRLVKITQPFIDGWSWRQSDVAMVARNFYLHGYNILQPQIDWVGAAPGYVGTEFPLVPFLAAFSYSAFGEHEWVGRSISIVFFTVSLPFLYLLVKRISGSRAALFTTCFYTLAPLSIYTSRSFMPDMPSLSLTIIAVYYFYDWIDDESKRRSLFASSLSLCLAILVKLPAIISGLPMLYLVWQKYGWRFLRKGEIWLFGGFVLILPALWYGHAYIVANANPPFHFFGAGGLGILGLTYYWSILERTFIGLSGLTPVISVLMVYGLFLVPKTNGKWLFHWWLLAVFIFLVLAAHGHRHAWYQLPFVPVAAALAGRALDVSLTRVALLDQNTKLRHIILSLLFLTIGAMSWIGNQVRYPSWNSPAREAGIAVRNMTPEESLILAVSNGDPTMIYYARRKGWHFFSWTLYSDMAIKKMEQCRMEGTDYLLIDKNFFIPEYFPALIKHLEENYQYLVRNNDYVILDLYSLHASSPERSHGFEAESCLETYN